jgi:hypothetical protein
MGRVHSDLRIFNVDVVRKHSCSWQNMLQIISWLEKNVINCSLQVQRRCEAINVLAVTAKSDRGRVNKVICLQCSHSLKICIAISETFSYTSHHNLVWTRLITISETFPRSSVNASDYDLVVCMPPMPCITAKLIITRGLLYKGTYFVFYNFFCVAHFF